MTVTVTENGISLIQDNVTVGGTTGSGGFDVPVGTTAERPGSPTAGIVRYNTTESTYEGYDGSDWIQILTSGYPYDIDYLVVAGGGGAIDSGSGGAGGSGVVILSVPTANYSGTTTGSPTVTTDGTDTILTFTSSGSYTA
jgi:hypothetical protein